MHTYQSILSQLYVALARLTQDRVTVTVDEDSELAGHLSLSSLQIMDLLMFIEDEFDISIPVNILPDVKTVRDLALQIEILTRGN